jgi:hypothetical protein
MFAKAAVNVAKYLSASKSKNKNWADVKAVVVYREFSAQFFKKFKAQRKLPADLVSARIKEML